MASRDGLLLAAGGEGGLAVGHGRLILKPLHQKGWTVMESFVSPKLIDFVTQKSPQRDAGAIEIPWMQRQRMQGDAARRA